MTIGSSAQTTLIEVGPFLTRDIAVSFMDAVRRGLKEQLPGDKNRAPVVHNGGTISLPGLNITVSRLQSPHDHEEEKAIEYKLTFHIPSGFDVDRVQEAIDLSKAITHEMFPVQGMEGLLVVTAPPSHTSEARGLDISPAGPASA